MKGKWESFIYDRWNMTAMKVYSFVVDNGKYPDVMSKVWPEKWYAEWKQRQETNFKERQYAMQIHKVRQKWSKLEAMMQKKLSQA
eukprot:2401862-Pleurochrysis_carterae.AAC.1